MKLLHNFVLIMVKPKEDKKDLALMKSFGVTETPALLFLDWEAKKVLGVIGDKPPEQISAKLKSVLRLRK